MPSPLSTERFSGTSSDIMGHAKLFLRYSIIIMDKSFLDTHFRFYSACAIPAPAPSDRTKSRAREGQMVEVAVAPNWQRLHLSPDPRSSDGHISLFLASVSLKAYMHFVHTPPGNPSPSFPVLERIP